MTPTAMISSLPPCDHPPHRIHPAPVPMNGARIRCDACGAVKPHAGQPWQPAPQAQADLNRSEPAPPTDPRARMLAALEAWNVADHAYRVARDGTQASVQDAGEALYVARLEFQRAREDFM